MLVYINARPETVFSLVTTGKLPENLALYIKEEKLRWYLSVEEAAKAIDATLRQAFLIEIDPGTPELLPSVTCVSEQFAAAPSSSQGDLFSYYQADSFEPIWIKRLLVFNDAASRLLHRLFNNSCVHAIELAILPDTFSAHMLSLPAIPYPSTVISSPQSHITYLKKGDLLGSKMQALVNTVNCVGVMGKGIALAFKTRYPLMFSDYKDRCSRKEVKLGEPYIYEEGGRKIINFPTKQHWRNDSTLEDIRKGLQCLAEHIDAWGIKSLAIPPLGCGNGGLNWKDVKPLIEEYLPKHLQLEIYEPTPESRPKPRTARSKRDRDIQGFFGPPSSELSSSSSSTLTTSISSSGPRKQRTS